MGLITLRRHHDASSPHQAERARGPGAPRPRQRAEASARAGGRRARAAGTAADERRRRAFATRGGTHARRAVARSRAEGARAYYAAPTSGWHPRRCARREGGRAHRPAANAHAALRASELHARRARRADRRGPRSSSRTPSTQSSALAVGPAVPPLDTNDAALERPPDLRVADRPADGAHDSIRALSAFRARALLLLADGFWGERGARDAPLPSRANAESPTRGARPRAAGLLLPLKAPSLASRAAEQAGWSVRARVSWRRGGGWGWLERGMGASSPS